MLQFDSEHFMEEEEGDALYAEASSLGLEPGRWPSKFELSFKGGSPREFERVNLAMNEENEVVYALYTETYEQNNPIKIKILND